MTAMGGDADAGAGAAPFAPFAPFAALDGLRTAARQRAAGLPLPKTSDEDFRYVRTAPLDQLGDFAVPERPLPTAEIAAWTSGGPTVVLVDGRVVAMARAEWPAQWALHLVSAWPDFNNASDPTTVWPWCGDGAAQRITVRGQHVAPLRIVALVSGGRSGWGLELELSAGAQLRVEIVHVPLAPGHAHTGVVARVGHGAVLHGCDIVSAPWPGVLTTACDLQVAAAAQVTWSWAGRGGALVRHRCAAELTGPGADLELHAALAVAGHDQAHLLTRVRHQAANRSAQLVKCLLDDYGATSFDGVVHMAPRAAGASADQQHRSLVRSATARADSRPQLDIRIDAVKAAHGSTIGAVDPEELLYLRARGLNSAQAGSVLAAAFLDAAIAAMPIGRDQAREAVGQNHASTVPGDAS